MAISTDALEHALEQLADAIRIAPAVSEASPGEEVSIRLLDVPDSLGERPAVPVEANIRWTVLDADGDRVPGGEQFVVLNGPAGETIRLLLRPPLVDHTAPAQDAPPLVRRVRATVTLTAQPPAPAEPVSVERQLEATVDVLPLRIPSVLALFRNTEFAAQPGGAALVVVPASSPFASRAAVDGGLAALIDALRPLAPIPGMATLRLRANVLRLALAGQPGSSIQFRRTDALANLNQITLIQNGPLTNDVEAEDVLSSLILLGPPERKAELYVRRNFDQAAGRLDVTIGAGGAVQIEDLHAKAPATVPDDGADVVVSPPGSRGFGDELSSLRLVPPLLHATLEGTATIEIDHPLAGPPQTIDLVIGLAFGPDRRTVAIEGFPTIDTSSATVTLTGGGEGTFDPATGAMTIDVALNFRLKTNQPIAKNCPIAFDLSTGSDASGRLSVAGDPLDRASGQITIVSAARFSDGFLEPSDASLVVTGTLSPLP